MSQTLYIYRTLHELQRESNLLTGGVSTVVGGDPAGFVFDSIEMRCAITPEIVDWLTKCAFTRLRPTNPRIQATFVKKD